MNKDKERYFYYICIIFLLLIIIFRTEYHSRNYKIYKDEIKEILDRYSKKRDSILVIRENIVKERERIKKEYIYATQRLSNIDNANDIKNYILKKINNDSIILFRDTSIITKK